MPNLLQIFRVAGVLLYGGPLLAIPLARLVWSPAEVAQIDLALEDALRQVQAIAAEDAAPDDQTATDPQRTDS